MFRRTAHTIIRCHTMGILGAILLTACAQLPVATDTSPQSPPDGACGNVLELYSAISRLSAESRRDMLQALRADVAASNEACSQLRLALMLSRPDTAYQDDETAASLLEEVLREPVGMQYPARGMALLLVEEIGERNRLRAEENALRLRFKQGQTATAVLRRQLRALQLQLDQLKSIERDINEKERAGAGANLDPEEDRKTP